MPVSDNWSVHLLTEYFSAVSAPQNEDAAIDVAVARAAEALDAEVGAAVIDDEVRGGWGFGSDSVPVELASAAQTAQTLTVAPMGVLHTALGNLGRHTSGVLFVARSRKQFGPEERLMLHGMAQVLGLALRGLRTLAAERTLREHREREAEERLRLLGAVSARQRLLETLLSIQRAISNRKPLQYVLDEITRGASSLLDDAVVRLVLRPAGGDQLSVASKFGPPVPGAVMDSDDGAVPPDWLTHVLATAHAAMRAHGVVTRTVRGDHGSPVMMLATPVHVSGEIGGSLVARVAGARGHSTDREMLSAFAQQVSLALTDAQTVQAMREAYHDSLTGLPNRALFLERLKQALANRAQSGDEVAVLFVDLDHFKDVNDSLGHSAGDELLAEVAKRIRACMRHQDTAARLGGDEFAVMPMQGDRTAAVELAERIIRATQEPFQIAGRDVFVDASVGVASSLTSRTDAAKLLSNADLAMYHAKKSGPGKTTVFEPHMHSAVLRRLEFHSDLKYALALAKLSLQFQPLINLESKAPVGVEALLRWTHPRHGMVSPTDLITIAEETGLIIELGRWVLWESTRQVAEWRPEVPRLHLNVNISGREIANPEFVGDVAEVLSDTGLPADLLTLELTETVLMSNSDTALPRLRQLKSLGVRLSIDDFGTGYSSLAYLCQFPVDQLKIDRSFVADVGTSATNRAIVRTVIELAHTLGLQTVAEGIEEEAQLHMLCELGCNLGQGYYLARPLDPDPAYAFLVHDTVGAA